MVAETTRDWKAGLPAMDIQLWKDNGQSVANAVKNTYYKKDIILFFDLTDLLRKLKCVNVAKGCECRPGQATQIKRHFVLHSSMWTESNWNDENGQQTL